MASILSSWILECLVFVMDVEEKDDLVEVSVEDDIVRRRVSHSNDA